MPTLINGSPTHALIVHAVAVLLPLSVLAALVLIFVPSSRRAFSLVSLVLAFAACLSVPLAFLSGGALRQRVPASPLVDHHVALAHQLLPVVVVFGLAFAAFVVADLARRSRTADLNRVESAVLARSNLLARQPSASAMRTTSRVAAVVLLVTAVATSVSVVRVGDSGAKAAWHGRVSSLPTGH